MTTTDTTTVSPPTELFVPGRICLFGEHSDWAGGYRSTQYPEILEGKCLIAGTNQGLYARVVSLGDGMLHLTSHLNTNEGDKEIKLTISQDDDALQKEASSDSLWSYICGTYYQVKKAFPNKNLNGLVLDNYKTTLPVKKGLSSSAAVSVLTARALNRLYNLNLSVQDEMEFAYLGETMTQSKCGRMDQGCAYGPNRLILMTCDGDNVSIDDHVPVGAPIYLILVDLGASKNTPAILHDLRNAYPVATDDVQRGVQDLLGARNHARMTVALDALKEGSAEKLGECMVQAQQEFDNLAMPASPKHLTSPVLHKLLQHEALKEYVFGGKGVGSQGDGSAQLVAKSEQHQRDAMELIARDFPNMTCLPLTLGE